MTIFNISNSLFVFFFNKKYNIHKEIQKRTIQFNNKPLSMTTQAIEMIVITVPLTYFSFAPINIYVTQQRSVPSENKN